MATYDQLKEEITAKVVAALTEKLANKIEEEAKPDFLDLDKDGDTEEPMKKAAEEAEEMNEAEEVELNEEEIEERKKRDTPRDSDRREPEKLKMNEEEQLEEMHCGGKRHDDLDPGMRCPMCGHIVMAEAEELEEAQEELEEVQEEEVVEETISNDEWYQNELFESLKKRWTK